MYIYNEILQNLAIGKQFLNSTLPQPEDTISITHRQFGVTKHGNDARYDPYNYRPVWLQHEVGRGSHCYASRQAGVLNVYHVKLAVGTEDQGSGECGRAAGGQS